VLHSIEPEGHFLLVTDHLQPHVKQDMRIAILPRVFLVHASIWKHSPLEHGVRELVANDRDHPHFRIDSRPLEHIDTECLELDTYIHVLLQIRTPPPDLY
jgi:hypothetical protein